MLRNDELRTLSKPDGFRSSFSIAFDWVMVAASFAVAILVPHPAVWALCFLFNARQQLAFAILMHDGAHRRLYQDFKVNDYVCQFLCAAPLFFSMYSYQKLHLKHHREPLAADDPDLSLIGGYPISKGSFARKLARDAFGISYYKFIRYFIHMARKPKNVIRDMNKEAATKDVGPAELKTQSAGKPMPMAMVGVSILVISLLLWGALYLLGQGWLFFFLWFLPAITALQVLLRIRGIAEHAGYTANPDQSKNARTVVNPLQTFVFAPHNVNFHIEHHLYPSVPFHRLPYLHKVLSERGAIPQTNVYSGYGKVIAELVR